MKKTKISLRPLATGRSGIRTRPLPVLAAGIPDRLPLRPARTRLLGSFFLFLTGLLRFSHSGSSDGFKAIFVGYPETGDGAVDGAVGPK